MQRANFRRWVLVVVVLLAAASMFPSIGGSSRHPSAPATRHTSLTAKHQQTVPAHTTPVRDDH